MRSALSAIRALGRQGIYVCGGEKTRFATGFFSKYCRKRFVYPDPVKKEKEFVEFILDLIKKEKFDAIIPMTNETLIPLSKNKKEISKYAGFPFQSYEKLMDAFDKSKTMAIAEKSKIPIPKTRVVYNKTQISENFPFVIKPITGSGSRGLFIIKNKKVLDEILDKIKFPCLLQEFIPMKGEIGVYTLFDKGKPVALTVQRRIRSYPISGGPSTLRESVIDREAEKLAFKLLEDMKWDGVAMVEFRRDSRDNKLKLMEINPRFWGSLELSVIAGVNFPYLLYKKAKGMKIEKNLKYKSGKKCRWLLPGDILWFISIEKSWKNIKSFFKFREKELYYDIASKDDPLPVLGFFIAVFRYCLSREMWKFVIRKA